MTEAGAENPGQLLEAAVAKHSSGNLAEASELYRRFLELVPEHADALHLRGMAQFALGDLEAAAGDIRAAIDVLPDKADFHANLGVVLKNKADYRDAIASFSMALTLKPDYPDCLNNMASTYLLLGQNSDAEDTLRDLLNAHPDYADGLNNLGVVVMSKQDYGEARSLFERVLELRPKHVDARVNLARLLVKIEDYAAAAEQYRIAVDDGAAGAPILRDYCDALTKSGQTDAAWNVGQTAHELVPGDADTVVTLGNVRQAMKQPDEAERLYRDALEIDPNNVRAINNLGTIAMARGDEQAALERFLEALTRDPDFVEAIFNAGTALQQLGDLAEAEKYYLEALARRPDLPRAYRYLAEIYRSDDRTAQRIDILDRWLELFPDSATARHLRASCETGHAPDRASDDYIREEFDDFADTFDETLKKLEYKTPALMDDLIRKTLETPAADILDAGCGTGLCGPLLKGKGIRLVGVDLSQKMLDQADARGAYDELVADEIVRFMHARPASFDLIVATDTLVYFGALEACFAAARESLRPGGHLAFSVERLREDTADGFRLTGSGRYSHSENYVQTSMQAAGFDTAAIEHAVLRLESNKPVEGLLVIGRL